MNLKINFFTNYNCGLLLFNILHKNNLDNLYAINCVTSWIVFYTFHLSLLLDKNTFKKIRVKNNISFSTFHSGNFILHILPYIYVIKYPAKNITINHSLIALLLKIIWCYISTNGTMDVGKLYVEFSKKNIINLYLISSSTALITPFFYNNYLDYTTP